MTADELKTARRALGLKAIDLGRALQLEGADPGRSVRLWEAGRPIPGPAAVAIGYMLAEKARQGLQEALQQAGDHQAEETAHAVAQALQADRQRRAAEGMPSAPMAMRELMVIPKITTRRRGR